MAGTTVGLVGREYLRVSRDASGVGRSPEQQHEENLAEFERRGWTLHPEPFRDEGSASRYATRSRDGFAALQEDLECDRLRADALVLWEPSRGSRTVGEWVGLLDLLEARGVQLFVTTHGRLYDPCNARDRRTLLEDAVDSEYESAKTSARLLRSTRAGAEQGRPHGKNLWGYRRIYDPQSRRLLRVEADPETGHLVQEAARRFLGGDTCYGIAADWNRRSIPTRRQARTEHRAALGWTPEAIRDILSRPSYAGIRTHHGETTTSLWPALIPRADFDRIQKLLRDRARPTDFATRHLLTGIARCGECGATLAVGRQRTGRRLTADGEPRRRDTYFTYVCRGAPGKTGFHVAMRETHLDSAVTEAVLARMERPDFLALVGQRDEGIDSERATILAEIESARAYLDEVRARAAAERRIDLVIDQEKRLQPVIEAAEQRLQGLTPVDPSVTDLARSGAIRDRWETLPVESKRVIIRGLVRPIVHRSTRPRGSKGLDLGRVELLWT